MRNTCPKKIMKKIVLIVFQVLMVTIGTLSLTIITQDDKIIDDNMNISRTRKPFETTEDIENKTHGVSKATRNVQTNTKDARITLDTSNLAERETNSQNNNEEPTENNKATQEIEYKMHVFSQATKNIQTNTRDDGITLDISKLHETEKSSNINNEESTNRKMPSNSLKRKIDSLSNSVVSKKSNRIIKIINGSESRSHEFPGAICLYQRNTLLHLFSFVQYKCTGVLITQHHILTAGHCLPRSVPRFLQYTNHYLAWGGHSNSQYIDDKISKRHEISDTNFKSGEQIRICNHWYKHPQQDSMRFIYDIGVIRCDLAFKLIPHVLEIVSIAPNFPFQEDTPVDMIGWGVFNSQNERHIYLNKYTTHILPPSACKNNYINITAKHHICTYNEASRSYKGDSGAPALYTIQRTKNCRKSQMSETQDTPGVTENSMRICKPVRLNIDEIFESLTNKTQTFTIPNQNNSKINNKLINKIQNYTLPNVEINKIVDSSLSNTTKNNSSTKDNLIIREVDETGQNQTTKSTNCTNINTNKFKENNIENDEHFTNPTAEKTNAAKTNNTKHEMDIGEYTCYLAENCPCVNTTNGNYYPLYTDKNHTSISPNEINNLTHNNHTDYNSFYDDHNLTRNVDQISNKTLNSRHESCKNNRSTNTSHESDNKNSNTMPESHKLYTCSQKQFIVYPSSKRFSHYSCNGNSIYFTSNINDSTQQQCLYCKRKIIQTIRCEKNKTHRNGQSSHSEMLDKIRRFNEIYHTTQNGHIGHHVQSFSVHDISIVNKSQHNEISNHETILRNENSKQFSNEISNKKRQFEHHGIPDEHYPHYGKFPRFRRNDLRFDDLKEKSSLLLDTKKEEEILNESYVCSVANITDSEYNEPYFGYKVIIGITSFHLNEYVVLTNITDEYYRFINEAIEKTDRISSLIWIDSEK